MVVERKDIIAQLREYNQTLSVFCTHLEKQFIKQVQQDYFYSFYFKDVRILNDVESFLKEQKYFKGLLPKHYEKLCHYLRCMHEWTCNDQLIRMDVRSKNFSDYQNKIIRAIGSFYVFYGTDMTMKELIYGRYRQFDNWMNFSSVIAERLLSDDQDVIQYCKDVLTSDNNTAVLTRNVIIAIEQSHHQELQDLLTQLFLAARLQEGLRQSVIETVDENNLDYFLKMIDVIAQNDLLRYSSVQRGVLTWIGIGYEIVKEKDVRYIFWHLQDYFHNENNRSQALQSENPLDIYLALYCKGVYDVNQAIDEALILLKSSKRHIVACALIYLKLTNCPYLHALLPYLKDYHHDQWIMALFISECCRYDYQKAVLTNDELALIFNEMETFAKTMKSQETYLSRGFEWFSITLYKSSICYHLYDIIAANPQIEFIERYLPYVASNLHDKRLKQFMEERFPLLDENKKKTFMLKEIISNNSELANYIEKEYIKLNLSSQDIIDLENRLKTKKAQARCHIVNVLAKQNKDQIRQSYQRLSKSANKMIQEAALELQQKVPHYFQDVKISAVKIQGKDEGFGLYRPYQSYLLPYHSKIKTIKKGLIIKKEKIDFSTLLPWNKQQVLEYLKKWDQRIILHQNDEYYNGYEYRQLKSEYFYPLNYQEHSLKALPLNELWNEYFQQDQLDSDIVFELRLLLEGIEFDKILNLETPLFTLYQKDIESLQYYQHITKLISYYFYEYENTSNYRDKAFMLLEVINKHCKYYQYKRRIYNNQYEIVSLSNIFFFLIAQLHLENANDQQFQEYFPMMMHCYENFNLKCQRDTQHKFTISPMILARAALLGIISQEAFYECILDSHNNSSRYTNDQHQLFAAYRDAYFEGTGVWKKPQLNLECYHHNRLNNDIEVFAYLRKELDLIADHLISMEKTRLNEKTAVTSYVENLYVVNGVKYLIDALHVLEHETLKRQRYGDDRNVVFTDLIRHCYPLSSDDPQTLKNENFKEERLVEVAMLAPQWIDFINRVLNWEGFKEACYYFIAHMKQYDYQQKKAQIAHYTQIDPQDLNDGAFDMEWCQNVYQLLGEKRFQMLYRAAKYLCENSFHSRARKYADACLKKIDLETLYLQMRQKRNKDALNAYCIYPLKDDQDLLERYLAIQQFLKESKQFGAQRQASEKRACEIALMNLAKNSRFETATRLSWMMETEIVKKYEYVLQPHQVDEIQLWIEIDDQGHNEIKVLKNKRKQKSIPAKLKNNSYVLEIKDIHKKWNEQYQRSRKMLEQAMEDRTVFMIDEIHTIMNNPIVAPMLSKLVLISDENLGFYDQGYLKGIAHREKLGNYVRIIHPYDLYKRQCWHEYQTYIYKQQIIQPFKQVFRELYLKLDDEKDQSSSKRYTGYQIQPKKAAAALKSRKWNVSYENGLEKIYYQDQLIVNLFAQADWFSPSDIEAPCIDYIQFYDKKNNQPMKICDIDDIVFSETMRDVDLAVSTAYVGGVDPITSFSTMELRKTIVEYTSQLMKLNNVEIKDHFACIRGRLNNYSVHLGSGIVHQDGGAVIRIVSVWSGKRGKVYLPFLDEDPKTAQIISEVVLFAQDDKIKDPSILQQIQTRKENS